MPAVAGGSPSALVVWYERLSPQDWDVFGRFLGYRVYLPVTLRHAGQTTEEILEAADTASCGRD